MKERKEKGFPNSFLLISYEYLRIDFNSICQLRLFYAQRQHRMADIIYSYLHMIFISITNNFQTDLFDPEMEP